jgi:predicted HTH domain antitoxin
MRFQRKNLSFQTASEILSFSLRFSAKTPRLGGKKS